MLLSPPSFLTDSQLIGYLNGFRMDPAAGLLTVSRLLPHDDLYPQFVTTRRETFREHHASEFAGEVEEVSSDVNLRFRRLGLDGASYAVRAGQWTLRSLRAPDQNVAHLTMENLAGRSIEIVSKADNLTLKVGFSSQDSRKERDARFSLSISRGEGEPRISCSYDIGFGSNTFDGLLRFLGVELTAERLEWMNRRQLWDAIRANLERDGFETDGYEADHLGLSWRVLDKSGEVVSGHLWTDDFYPSLQFHYPSFSPLAPSFVPLWRDTSDLIGAWEKRVRSPRISAEREGVSRSAGI